MAFEMSPEKQRQQLIESFQLFDRQRTGLIERNELKFILTHFGIVSEDKLTDTEFENLIKGVGDEKLLQNRSNGGSEKCFIDYKVLIQKMQSLAQVPDE